MTVVDFTITPPARTSTPWTHVRIEEATSVTGPWVVIDTLSIPVDSSPDSPDPITVETTNAVADDYFRLIFTDAASDESFPSDVISRSVYQRVEVLDVALISPSVTDISSLLHGRISEGSTVFDANTNPTATQVSTLIGFVAAEVFSRCESIPQKQIGLARHVVALGTCIAVERGYFPQETDNTASPLSTLIDDFNVKMSRLELACKLSSSRVLA